MRRLRVVSVLPPLMSPLAPEEIAGLGFEAVVRNAPVAISVIAASGRVIYSNARAQELTSRQLGYDMPADLDGAIDIFHPDGRRYERHEWPAIRLSTSGEEIAEEEFFYALPDRCACSSPAALRRCVTGTARSSRRC